MKGTYRAYALSIKNLHQILYRYILRNFKKIKKTHALQNGGKFDYLGKLENSLADP